MFLRAALSFTLAAGGSAGTPDVLSNSSAAITTVPPFLEPEGESSFCWDSYRCCGGEKGSRSACPLTCPEGYDERCQEFPATEETCPETWKMSLSGLDDVGPWCCQCVHRSVEWPERPCNHECPCWDTMVSGPNQTCGDMIKWAGFLARFSPSVPYSEQIRAQYPEVCACNAQPHAEVEVEVGKCEFENEPLGVGSFWDPTCSEGGLGCNADGKNVQCRLCGAGDFDSIRCPASSCHFDGPHPVSYFWDPQCQEGKLGCMADGTHLQCRFCGEAPFASVPCPADAHHATPRSPAATCNFDEEPEFPYFVDPQCEESMLGCGAGGSSKCRFCGKGPYAQVPCDAYKVCQADSNVPHYWDQECAEGMLGCKADGKHLECRYCGQGAYEDVPCPSLPETAVEVPSNLRR